MLTKRRVPVTDRTADTIAAHTLLGVLVRDVAGPGGTVTAAADHLVIDPAGGAAAGRAACVLGGARAPVHRARPGGGGGRVGRHRARPAARDRRDGPRAAVRAGRGSARRGGARRPGSARGGAGRPAAAPGQTAAPTGSRVRRLRAGAARRAPPASGAEVAVRLARPVATMVAGGAHRLPAALVRRPRRPGAGLRRADVRRARPRRAGRASAHCRSTRGRHGC